MIITCDYKCENIYGIDLDELKSQGIKAIMFDLDSTIMVSKSATYSEKTRQWLETVQKEFLVAVVTNNNNPSYIEKVRAVSPFKVVADAKKPKTDAMSSLLAEYNIQPHEACMVGDRPLTDIVAGNRLGCKTILVGSINAENEGPLVQFVRWLERCTMKS